MADPAPGGERRGRGEVRVRLRATPRPSGPGTPRMWWWNIGEHEVAALRGLLEPSRSDHRRASSARPSCAATSASAAERPGGMDLRPLPLVAVHRRLGLAPRLRPVAAEQEQAREHHDVERVVAAGPGLRADRSRGSSRSPGRGRRSSGRARRRCRPRLPSPRSGRPSSGARRPRSIVARSRRPHEPELAGRAEQQRVRERVAVDGPAPRPPARAASPPRRRGRPALEVALHHEIRRGVRGPWRGAADRRRPRRAPARRARSPREPGRGSSG